MRWRIAGIVVLLLLVAAVAWQWRGDEADARAHRLTTLDPDALRGMTVELRGSPPQHLERREGHWSSPEGAVDEGRAEELAALAATPVAEWKPGTDFDPAKIGLQPPQAVLTLDGTRIEFGEMTALGRMRYARVGDRIAFVPAEALPRPPRMKALPTQDIR